MKAHRDRPAAHSTREAAFSPRPKRLKRSQATTCRRKELVFAQGDRRRALSILGGWPRLARSLNAALRAE